ncbi:MAG: recombination protein O N-terminal domain-containing protein [Bacteroidales bacterium]|nr:recombination protein O N-terminal domain-containing protein [Bacteroidales bacterium]MBQ8809044.1 recombination protein O N-terminal domain-containing protein [Bacteroidales bacterium]
MTQNTELIVLHTTKFGENSLVVHTLSREYGRRSFLVKGAGKKSTMSLFLPLNMLEADIIETNKSTLFTARNLIARHPLLGIRSNMFKNSMTMFMSEVLYRVVKDGASEQGLFEWCERNILMLDAIQTDFSNFHIRFLLELAVALGFSPEAQDLMPFVGDHYPVVEKFMSLPFAESMLIPLNGQVRNEIAEEILRYIEFHTESAVNVNSLKVLRELFV